MTNQSHTEKNVAEIAAGLTKAQRDAISGRRSPLAGSGMWTIRKVLYRKGLTTGWDAELTPLGLAVRNHLISTPDMPKGDG